MKATGIVRRIDDLGRVVIPKEIRRTMRIREGDPWRSTPTRTAASFSRNIPSWAGWRSLPASCATTLNRTTGRLTVITRPGQLHRGGRRPPGGSWRTGGSPGSWSS